MLRQTASAASRALRSTARLGTQRQAIALAQSSQTPLAAARTLGPRTRWYSSETDAAKKNGEEAKANGEAESTEAALKKQLEAKDAEIRDLKVGITKELPVPRPC
jgi:molecular chaperone GrpE